MLFRFSVVLAALCAARQGIASVTSDPSAISGKTFDYIIVSLHFYLSLRQSAFANDMSIRLEQALQGLQSRLA